MFGTLPGGHKRFAFAVVVVVVVVQSPLFVLHMQYMFQMSEENKNISLDSFRKIDQTRKRKRR